LAETKLFSLEKNKKIKKIILKTRFRIISKKIKKQKSFNFVLYIWILSKYPESGF
jgi:hypothetical protein